MKKIIPFILFFGNLAVILWFWLPLNRPLLQSGDFNLLLMALGRLAGLFAVYFVLTQLILIGRVKWVESLFGLDRLSRVHHWNGFLILLFILAHPVLLITSYAGSRGMTLTGQFLDFFRSYDNVDGAVIGLVLFLFVIGFSLAIVRLRLRYETWHATHLLTYAAILFSFGHQLKIGGDFQNNPAFVWYWYGLYAFVVVNFVWYRFARPLRFFFKHRFRIDRVVQETLDTASVYITGQNLETFPGEAGQFMILRFLTKGFWWQAHPFSLSVKPNGEFLRVTIKNVGDFTSKIPNLQSGTRVLIDGPHGVFTEKQSRRDKILLIAGGIGITPLRALAEQMVAQGRDVSLLYGNKTSGRIALKKELDSLVGGRLRVNYVISDDPSWTGERGHIDEKLLKRLVPDLIEREVYLCGPPIMMTKIRKYLKNLGLPRRLVHFEKFSLS